MSHAPKGALSTADGAEAPDVEAERRSGRNAGTSRVHRLGSDTLRTVLVAALILRAALSVTDAVTAMRGGVQLLPIEPSIAFGASTPFWPTVWAVVSLAGAVGLAYRSAAGWVLAGAACLGYLAGGVGNLGLLDTAVGVNDPSLWAAFVLDVAIPAAVLAGLYQLRGGYVHLAKRPALRVRPVRRPRT